MTTTDKPSIAELQRAAACSGDPTQQSVLLRADVAAVLLEIAAAAMARQDTPDWENEQALNAALSKVRP